MKLFHGTLRSILVATIALAPVWGGTAQEDLKKAVSGVLKILDGSNSKKAKRAAITKIYNTHFDVDKMGANTLKSDFKQLSDEQKSTFCKKFGRFVLEFYLDKIDKYERNKIEFIGEEMHGSRATVNTLLEYQGKMAKVNYSMVQKGNAWLVYDFEIEGVRLSSTYRSQFARVLKEKGFEGLTKALDKLLSKYNR